MRSVLFSLAIYGLGLVPMLAAQKDPRPKPGNRSTTEQIALTDSYGDPLPEGALARLGTARFRHVSGFTRFYLSPDEKLMASSSAGNNSVRLWDTATGKELFRLTGPEHLYVSDAAFSPDCRNVAVSSLDGKVRVWDLQTRKLRLQLDHASERVLAVAYSPNSAIIASSEDSMVPPRSFRGQQLPHADPQIIIWEGATGKVLHTLKQAGHATYQLAFSPDGKTLASVGSDKTVRLWDVTAGKQSAQLDGHESYVSSVAFTRDGKKLVSAAYDQTVRVWDAGTGKQELRLDGLPKGHGGMVAVSNDGKMIGVASDGPEVFLWDTAAGKKLPGIVHAGHRFCNITFTRDNRVLLSDNHGSADFWDPKTGQQIDKRFGHWGRVTALAYSPDGKTIATGSDDQTIRLWDATTAKQVTVLQGPMGDILALAISANGNSLACSSGTGSGLVHVWDVKMLKYNTVSLPEDLRAFQYWLAISPDGQTVACSSHGDKVYVCDVPTGKVRFEVKVRRQTNSRTYTNPMAFSPDSNCLAISHPLDTNDICIFDVHTGALRRRLPAWGGEDFLAYTPGGEAIVYAGSDPNAFTMIDAVTGKVLTSADIRSRSEASVWIYGGGVSPDGRMIAVTTDKTIDIFELATAELIRKIPHGAYRPRFVAFSPDGKNLACPGPDADAIVWSLAPKGLMPVADGKLSQAELAALWADLGSNAAAGQKAIWLLAAAPKQATAFLDQRMKRLPPVDPKRLNELLVNLDDAKFSVREAATYELKKLGRRAEPALRKLLTEQPSEEVRRRVQSLLTALGPDEPMPLKGDALQAMRAIQVLERIGTRDAIALLEELSEGAVSARTAREAQGVLRRLVNKL